MEPRLRRLGGLLTGLLLLHAGTCARGQEADGQAWSQFTRENTVRGTMTNSAGGASAFEIRTDGGETWRVLYGPNTKLIKGREPAKPADFHAGDMLFAAGDVDAKKKQIGAAILVDVDAEEVRKAREGLGKTWSAGRVTAVAGRRITIQRMDGVAQTIAVDENTSFQQRRESVTLADVKPGAGVRAEGRLVDGVFTATLLRVFEMKGNEPWMSTDGEKR